MNRSALTTARRVVIKVGSSSLTGAAGAELDPAAVKKVVDVALDFFLTGVLDRTDADGHNHRGPAPGQLVNVDRRRRVWRTECRLPALYRRRCCRAVRVAGRPGRPVDSVDAASAGATNHGLCRPTGNLCLRHSVQSVVLVRHRGLQRRGSGRHADECCSAPVGRSGHYRVIERSALPE